MNKCCLFNYKIKQILYVKKTGIKFRILEFFGLNKNKYKQF